MQAFGRELTFYLDTRAVRDLTALCPNHDFTKLGELFGDGDAFGNMDSLRDISIILSREGEALRKHDDPSYEPHPLTEEEFDLLPIDALTALLDEAFAAINRDSKTEIQAEPVKKERADGKSRH